MVCCRDGCHFERELLFRCCSPKWCPVLGKTEVPWMLYPEAVMWRAPSEEVLLVVAGSPHLPIRHNKTSEPSSAGCLNNSSLLLHTGDGATVTCVNSNPSHNIVCTPQADTQGYEVSKNLLSLSEQQYVLCCSLSIILSAAAGLGHGPCSSPPSSCICSAPLSLPAAERDARWQTVAYVPLVRSDGRQRCGCPVAERDPVYLKMSRVDTESKPAVISLLIRCLY